VDFDLSDDQVALRDGARELLDGMSPAIRVRAVAGSDARWDEALWAGMVEQGWLGVALPESEGGLGLGAVELAVLLEEIGRHVAPVPFLSSVLAIEAFRRAGDAATVEQLVGGERIACVAWADDARERLGPVAFAPVADVAVVVRTDGRRGTVDAFDLTAAPEARPSAEPAMELTRPLGWLEPRGGGRRLGGDDLARELFDRAATGTSVEMLGAAGQVLDMAVEYAKDRVQFGRPIGSFQAVKHRCADMLVDVEGMRSTSYWASWCLAADDDAASIAASTAKTWCSDASKRVMASALQVHGGIGFTWEHDLHLYLKRAQLDQVSFGDATFHRERLTALLRAHVEAGESVV
jgi:alkylation response protein AidB-like acyl-CoA dehydrogenase